MRLIATRTAAVDVDIALVAAIATRAKRELAIDDAIDRDAAIKKDRAIAVDVARQLVDARATMRADAAVLARVIDFAVVTNGAEVADVARVIETARMNDAALVKVEAVKVRAYVPPVATIDAIAVTIDVADRRICATADTFALVTETAVSFAIAVNVERALAMTETAWRRIVAIVVRALVTTDAVMRASVVGTMRADNAVVDFVFVTIAAAKRAVENMIARGASATLARKRADADDDAFRTIVVTVDIFADAIVVA